MKSRLILLLFAAVMTGCSAKSTLPQQVSVIPEPSHLSVGEGKFDFSRSTRIVVDQTDADMVRVAGYLNERLGNAAGFCLALTDKAADNAVVFTPREDLASEGYTLNVLPHRIEIGYSSPAGAFYALQTLFQLLPAEIYASSRQPVARWSAPCVEIRDEPRFAYRGMHLDVCSHFFDVDYIKRYIDLMAVHKINRFHWHLTEDQGWRIEIKKYPLLTEKGSIRKETVIGSYKSKLFDDTPYGGYYTQDEIREIVKYAADRFITIIPEIEMPGHALAAIACYPELSCELEPSYEVGTRWGIYRQVYCPKENTFAFLEDVLTEVFQLFPSKLIHIGGDECPKKSWQACPDCQALIKRLGLKDEFELQSYFVQRIEKFVNASGREIIGWDEILQGGLAPNAKVMSWLGEEGGIKAAQQHHEVVMSPHNRYYLDYYQADPETEAICMGSPTLLRTMYDYNPVPDVLTPEQGRYIIGVEGCVWTEYMASPARVEYMAYPRMAAIAESGWTLGKKDYDSFTRRLEHHFERLDALGVDYCRAFYDPQIEFCDDSAYTKVVAMKVDAPDAEIRYTLDGTAPNASSKLYTLPFVVNRSQQIKAVAIRDGKPLGNTVAKQMR